MDIVARAEAAGVAGAAGAGYPLHDRLTRRLETVIANGAECEPLLAADRAVMTRYPEQVLQGLVLALEATGAARGFIAVRGIEGPVMSALTQARRRFPHVTVVALEDFYPAGSASSLVQEILGYQVPPGVHPEDTGTMVANVHTLWHLAEAARGRPVTHRFVTVAGEVQRPQTLRVPIGTRLEEVAALCGGPTRERVAYVTGGPVRGKLATPDTPVTKSTPAVLVLPEEHPVVARQSLPLDAMLKRAASSCSSCRICTDRCPQHLLGYGIEPHLLMRGLVHRLDTIPEVVTGAGSCIGCRVCESVCPAQLAPGRFYAAIAKDLVSRGLRELPRNPARAIHEALHDRKVDRGWLTRRLGVARYSAPLPVDDNYHPVERVVLPLGNAEPVVAEGQKVALGDLVAQPAGLGSRVHSPIAGRVARISGGRLEVVRD